MARVNHKRVKQLLNEKRSKITDKQFFTSRILAGSFEDIAAAQSKRYHYNRRVHVNIYWDSKDPNGAMTNNQSIIINAGHPTVTKVRGRENRYLKNPNVRDGYYDLANLISKVGLEYGTYLWDPHFKGLDDYVWHCRQQGTL